MATRFIIITISLLVFISPSSSSSFTAVVRHRSPSQPPPSHQIRQACKATRYQQLCKSSLTRSPTTKPLEIIQFALSISSKNLRVLQSKIHSILQSSIGNHNLTTAAEICTEHLRHAEYRLNLTAVALRRRRIKDGRAWTSSALSYQSVCYNELKKLNNNNTDLKMINETMSFIDTLIGYISNALSMMMAYDVFGDQIASWRPPETERERFWEVGTAAGGGGGPKLRIPVGLKVNVTVCKGGGCRYSTVQEAVDAAADWGGGGGRWFVIWVKAGVYKETVRVGLEKQKVVILGEGMGKTVITGALNVGQTGISTYGSATVGVVGDGFMARGLTIENTAGPVTHQAVAFRSESDQSIIEDCEFLGNQDTLYLPSHRQLFKSCRIQGNVDFIFGNSASIFQDCTILIRPRQQNPEKGETNTVTAHSRTDPAQSTGFVFQNCLVNGTEEYMRLYQSNPKVHKNYLGRPWKEFSRTVFIGCKMEALIAAEGWTEWTGDFGLKTLYYGEFGNSGKGSDLSGRVAWSSRIPANHVNVYSIRNFIQGDQWKLTS